MIAAIVLTLLFAIVYYLPGLMIVTFLNDKFGLPVDELSFDEASVLAVVWPLYLFVLFSISLFRGVHQLILRFK